MNLPPDHVKALLDWELVLRAMRYALRRRKKHQPAWSAVMDVFALGSTKAKELCVRFNVDPETGLPI